LLNWGQVALILWIAGRVEGGSASLRQAFSQARRSYWWFLGISILYTLICGVGFLLLAVPGTYWGVVFLLAPLVVVLEDRDGIGPFRRSRELVSGSFWRVLILFLVEASLLLLPLAALPRLDQVLGSVLWTIWQTVTLPFGLAVDVILYSRLREREPKTALREGVERRGKRGCLMGCLGAVGLCVAFAILAGIWIIGLASFAKTERGHELLDRVMGVVSPRIVLEGGMTLERPPGWLVGSLKPGYVLFRPGNERITSLYLWSYSAAESDFSKAFRLLDDEVLRKAVGEKSARQLRGEAAIPPVPGGGLPGMESYALGGKMWDRLSHASRIRPTVEGPSRMCRISVIYYTAHREYCVLAHFFFLCESDTTEALSAIDTTARREEAEVREILTRIHYP
jgi:hypothetical protein